MANPEYVLEMRDIVKVFPGVRALDGVKLQVRPARCTLSAARTAQVNPR